MKRIRTEKDYEKALNEIEALMDMPEDERDNALMERLSELLTVYEEEHYAIDPPPVAASLQFRMEQEGLSQADVSRITGIHKSKISEILSGNREPSKEQIRTLHHKMGIPLQHLLGEMDDCDNIEIDCTSVTGYPDLASVEMDVDFEYSWGENDEIDDAWQSCEKILAAAA